MTSAASRYADLRAIGTVPSDSWNRESESIKGSSKESSNEPPEFRFSTPDGSGPAFCASCPCPFCFSAGGCHSTMAFGPLGAPDSVITTGSTVVSLNTCSPGLPIVALVAMNFKFSLPHSRHTLSTLRNTFPTCDPPTPRKTCASSNTRNSKLCQKLEVHFLGYPGKIRWCNESGLVKTICVFSVFIRARCASDESPSQVALVIFEMARSLCNVFLSPSNEPLSAKRPAAFVSCCTFNN
mmetsp:Transcript_10687/g.39562  ORF Transcript_10687/g.39562 Transcript_10687/m.39562 type:complete len:239 (-) Transcript_10687:911-1627(-)